MKTILLSGAAVMALGISAANAQGIKLGADAHAGFAYSEARDEDKTRAVGDIEIELGFHGKSGALQFGAIIDYDTDGDESEHEIYFGTERTSMTIGETDGAAEHRVSQISEVGLTGFDDFHELDLGGNGVQFRLDHEVAGLGLSLSTDDRLDDFGAGGSYQLGFGQTLVKLGGGYHRPEGADEVWSGSLGVGHGPVVGEMAYVHDTASSGREDLALGLGYDVTQRLGFSVIAIEDLEHSDTRRSYGLGAKYDLGGGAAVRSGIVTDANRDISADLGVSMQF